MFNREHAPFPAGHTQRQPCAVCGANSNRRISIERSNGKVHGTRFDPHLTQNSDIFLPTRALTHEVIIRSHHSQHSNDQPCHMAKVCSHIPHSKQTATASDWIRLHQCRSYRAVAARIVCCQHIRLLSALQSTLWLRVHLWHRFATLIYAWPWHFGWFRCCSHAKHQTTMQWIRRGQEIDWKEETRNRINFLFNNGEYWVWFFSPPVVAHFASTICVHIILKAALAKWIELRPSKTRSLFTFRFSFCLFHLWLTVFH